MLKAGGEQSVTLAGTLKMQLWHVRNWDLIILLVSKSVN